MDMLFHFVFSIIVGMAIFRGKRKLLPIVSIAFLSILIDTDHFFGLGARGTFHNIFFVFLIPFIAFLVFYQYENKKSIKLQTYALLLMVMLAGHVTADMFYGGGVKLLYPFSNADFFVPQFSALASSQFYSPLITSDGIALSIYALILLSAFFIEDFIFFFEKKHEKLRKAISSAKSDLF